LRKKDGWGRGGAGRFVGFSCTQKKRDYFYHLGEGEKTERQLGGDSKKVCAVTQKSGVGKLGRRPGKNFRK